MLRLKTFVDLNTYINSTCAFFVVSMVLIVINFRAVSKILDYKSFIILWLRVESQLSTTKNCSTDFEVL
jgi:hypothetical protein